MVSTVPRTRPAANVLRASHRRIDRAALVVALCITVGTAYRLWLVLAGVPPTNSDESTMGLAALHIAEGRDFPVYFYGQHYMGTLEAYLAAPLFVTFGPSLTALRLPLLPVYIVFCVLMYQLTRRIYTRWFAVAVVALLAFGSDSVVRSETFAGGGYPELKPLGAGLLLLAVCLAGRPVRPTRWRWCGFAGWGLLAGLVLWDDWLILPYLTVAGAVLFAGCWRELLGRSGVLLVAGALAGAAPAIGYHLRAAPGQTTLAGVLAVSKGGDVPFWDRFHGAVLMGVPLGTGVCGPGICGRWPLIYGAVYPLLLAFAGMLALVALCRAVRKGARFAADREPTRQAGRLALVVAAAVTLAAYTHSNGAGNTPSASVRYLCPLLLSMPAVLWPLWSVAGRAWPGAGRVWPAAGRMGFAAGRAWSPAGRTWRAAAPAFGAAALALFTLAMVAGTVAVIQGVPGNRAVGRDERTLVAAMTAAGLTRVYSDYWTCNRLAFATRERVVCATLTDELRPGLDRYRPFRDMVGSAAGPAYVLPSGSIMERVFAQRLSAAGVAADVSETAGYRIYRPAGRVPHQPGAVRE